jgi:hypothetical protein
MLPRGCNERTGENDVSLVQDVVVFADAHAGWLSGREICHARWNIGTICPTNFCRVWAGGGANACATVIRRGCPLFSCWIYQNIELMQLGIAKMITPANKLILTTPGTPPADAWLIVNTPIFSLTQDQRALVLNNVVTIRHPDGIDTATYKNTVKVVSRAIDTTDPVAYWTTNESDRLKAETAALLAESLDVALNEISAKRDGQDVPHKTIRYHEGNVEKVERAQLLGEHSGRSHSVIISA